MSMERIETDERALRLARTIVGDIRLYNADAVARQDDMTAEVAEGRALFRQRTLPALHHIYEEIVANAGLVDHAQPIESISQKEEDVAPTIHSTMNADYQNPMPNRSFDKLSPTPRSPAAGAQTPERIANSRVEKATPPHGSRVTVPGIIRPAPAPRASVSDSTQTPDRPAVSPIRAILEQRAKQAETSSHAPTMDTTAKGALNQPHITGDDPTATGASAPNQPPVASPSMMFVSSQLSPESTSPTMPTPPTQIPVDSMIPTVSALSNFSGQNQIPVHQNTSTPTVPLRKTGLLRPADTLSQMSGVGAPVSQNIYPPVMPNDWEDHEELGKPGTDRTIIILLGFLILFSLIAWGIWFLLS